MLFAGPFAAFPDPLYHISLDLRYLISSRPLARLRTHPIRDYELIRDMEYYFDHHAAHSKIKSGLVNINDLGELFLFDVYDPQ